MGISNLIDKIYRKVPGEPQTASIYRHLTQDDLSLLTGRRGGTINECLATMAKKVGEEEIEISTFKKILTVVFFPISIIMGVVIYLFGLLFIIGVIAGVILLVLAGLGIIG